MENAMGVTLNEAEAEVVEAGPETAAPAEPEATEEPEQPEGEQAEG